MVSGSVLVCGSRGVSLSPRWLADRLVRVCPPDSWLVISGGARGVDRAAPLAAGLLGWQSAVMPPRYAELGRRAPLVRDVEMVLLASFVFAVWDGASRGTAYTLSVAYDHGRPVVVLPPP